MLGSETAGWGSAFGVVVGPRGNLVSIEVAVSPAVLDVAQELMPALTAQVPPDTPRDSELDCIDSSCAHRSELTREPARGI